MVSVYKFFLFGFFVVTAANAVFLSAEKFPTTIEDVSFSDRIENSVIGYAPFKDANPYLYIQLQDINDKLSDEVGRISQEHESYCTSSGLNKPECMPYTPDTSVSTTEQPIYDDAYCENAHPYIIHNQTLPLGVPISPSLDIYSEAQNGHVCSGFGGSRGGGHVHQGVDIGCQSKYFDSQIYAIADGVVSIVKADYPDSTAGNYIVIKHVDGFESWYMHLNSIQVSTGQRVKAGCPIGKMGYTGGSLGLKKQGKPFRMGKNLTHLHYELHNTKKIKTIDTPKGTIILKYGKNNAFDPVDMLKYH